MNLVSLKLHTVRLKKFYGTGEDADKVIKVRVSDSVVYMTADEEEGMTIAQANSPIDAEGYFTNEHVACRRGHDVLEVTPDKVDYMDVSPKEVVSIGTAMIPFLKCTMPTCLDGCEHATSSGTTFACASSTCWYRYGIYSSY